ncbi:hypothetical protein [uncultured Winogradskyella sp.]|uniref:hypothetical protein n=1 Tax=uncultured Winogradskyella sp. TaxID=395353 RepID=UPI002628903D|nr:hypothetical protein [uncultured Winogradskyella sp.]
MSEPKKFDFDQFWLEKGQELVNQTFTNLNRHLNNYNTYLNILLGVYTAYGLTLTALFKSENTYIYVGFFLPLILVYWAIFKISVGQEIPLDSLDMRSPIKINNTHNRLITSLKKDILNAKRMIGIATFAVLMGGSITTFYLNKEVKEFEKNKLDNDAKKERKKDSLKIADDIFKEFKKDQKFYITTNKKDQKATIEAKLLEGKTIEVKYLDLNGKAKTSKPIRIPKFMDYKRDLDSVKSIINIKVLNNN